MAEDGERDWSATTRLDVTDPLSDGREKQLEFEPFRLVPTNEGNNWTNQLDQVGQLVLQLVIFDAQACSAIGSATMVAPGVAITADHVFDDWKDRLQSGAIRVMLLGFVESAMCAWHLRACTPIPKSDLAILSLALGSDLPPDNRFQLPHLSLRLPKVGEPIVIVGFREVEAEATAEGVSVTARLFHCTGPVAAHFPEGRHMLPGQHIAISCNPPGGVSGGAAFDVNGNLVGVLSTSIDTKDGKGPASVSLLHPAMIQEFPVHWMVGEPGQSRTRLLEIKEGFCNIENRAAIKYEELGDDQVALTYDDET